MASPSPGGPGTPAKKPSPPHWPGGGSHRRSDQPPQRVEQVRLSRAILADDDRVISKAHIQRHEITKVFDLESVDPHVELSGILVRRRRCGKRETRVCSQEVSMGAKARQFRQNEFQLSNH